jgi:tRNA dimethylallyltransferase
LARQPLSTLHARGRVGLGGFRVFKIGLCPDRAGLYQRINRRVEAMFAGGLLDEARVMLARPDANRIKPLGALGYRQACAFLRGECTLPEAVSETQAATRRYAKRQMTWFRGETEVAWFGGFGDDPGIQHQILRERLWKNKRRTFRTAS